MNKYIRFFVLYIVLALVLIACSPSSLTDQNDVTVEADQAMGEESNPNTEMEAVNLHRNLRQQQPYQKKESRLKIRHLWVSKSLLTIRHLL